MTQDEIEGFLQDYDEDLIEDIKDADDEDEAESIASDALNDEGHAKEYESADLLAVVRKIRAEDDE